MRLLSSFLIITIFLIGCQTNRKPLLDKDVFFEQICVGDNLETCLANGTVQYSPRNELKLANIDIVRNNFTYTAVKFDEKNIIKEIELTFRKKVENKSSEEVFSFMTQYLCQRYKGFKSEKISNEMRHELFDLSYWQEGIQNIWQTDKITIILKSYENRPIPNTYYSELEYNTAKSAAREIEGGWVKLNIIAK